MKITHLSAWLLAGIIAVSGSTLMAENDDNVLAGPKVGKEKVKDGEGPGRRMQREDGAFAGRPGRGGPEGRRPGGPGGPGGPDGHLRAALGKLDLTDDQKAEIKTILDGVREEHKAFFEENKDKLEAIREEMKAAREAKDREAMMAAREKMKALMESGPERGAAIEKIKEVLTEEQLAKLEEMRKNARERRGEGGPEGRRRPGPGGEEGGPGADRPRRRGPGGEEGGPGADRPRRRGPGGEGDRPRRRRPADNEA